MTTPALLDETDRPAMLLSLDHVTVRSTDFDRSERFYCGLLGLRAGPHPAFKVRGRWLYAGEAPILHVLPHLTSGATPAAGVIDHFALRASGLPQTERRLQAAGHAYELRRLADTQIWQLFITDPDGALIELSFNLGSAAAPSVSDRK